MTIEKAIDQVLWFYENAILASKNVQEEPIRNPIEWALYKTWRMAIGEERTRVTKEKIENILVDYGVAYTDCLAERLLKEFQGV